MLFDYEIQQVRISVLALVQKQDDLHMSNKAQPTCIQDLLVLLQLILVRICFALYTFPNLTDRSLIC